MSSAADNRIVVREGMVVLNEMADRLGLNRSNFRKIAMKSGVPIIKKRLASTGGQLVNVVTKENAEQIIKARRSEFLGSDQIEYLD